MLALAQPTEAKVIYTKTHDVIGTNGVYPLDLNHDGIIDFVIQELGYSGTSGSNGLWADAASGNGVEATKGYAAALMQGASIGPRQRFQHISDAFGEMMGGRFCNSDTGGCTTVGQWVNVKIRYLGLKFQIKGKVHYGWARLNVIVSSRVSTIAATLTGYAYETTPNKAIHAGQTHGPVDEALGTPDAVKQETLAHGRTTQVPLIGQSASLGRLAQGYAVPLGRQP
jgi:hypothetical protein